LIWKLAPFITVRQGIEVQGTEVAAKDHLKPSEAKMQAWAIGIRLNEDPCR
jgi:hypothetical protein